MKIASPLPVCLLLACAAGILCAQDEKGADEFERPPLFEVAQFLTLEQMAGPHHRVRELAPGDGYLIHFTIDSDFGAWECVGYREFQRRLAEIHAIARLVEISKSDLFAEGVRKSIESPIEAVKNIVHRPGETVESIPHTVGHFFSEIGSKVENAIRDKDENDGTNIPPDDVRPKKGLTRSLAGVAGFNRAKREAARQLGIDPYSPNPRLQEELEEVTWPFFAGGLPLRIGMKVASSGASLAVTTANFVELPDDLYDLNPLEIAERDRAIMTAAGVEKKMADKVIGNTALSASLRHSMLVFLNRLEGPGRDSIVKLISLIESNRQAYFLNDVLRLMAWRQQFQPYSGFGVYGNLPAAITAERVMEVCAPVDYMAWTERVADFATREDWGGVNKRLILDGAISERAEAEMKRAGWEIVRIEREKQKK